ncbi:MAG: Hsp20/alpha crystallin family protein [bacterium]|nr:Hsp20/alpha crystallin family protein [bacterium]
MLSFSVKPPLSKPLVTDTYTVPLLRPDRWLEEVAEGELSVDVYETDTCFAVRAAIAGVRPEDVTLAIHRDLLTIRGERRNDAPHPNATYLVDECFWGKFSRSILLPEPVDVPRAEAKLQHGVLTIVLPKIAEHTHITIDAME